MSTPTQTNEAAPQTSKPAKDLGELTFAEYEAVRRGGAAPASSQTSAPGEKKPEQKAASDSEAEETEEVDAKSDEQSDDESEAKMDSEESKDGEKAKPKKSGYQRRVDKLNARISDAQREAEYWKQQALKGIQSESKKDIEEVESPKSASASADGKPNPDNFDTHTEYVEALTDWKLEQREKAKEAESRKAKMKSEAEAAEQAHTARVKAFMEKTEDFVEVLEAVEDIPVSQTAREVIMSSEMGPELMYELAKNRDELARISKLGPIACAREIGKLEARLAKSSAEENKPEPKKITKAPKPIEPVGSGKTSVAKSIADPDISFAEYERLRRQQMKRR